MVGDFNPFTEALALKTCLATLIFAAHDASLDCFVLLAQGKLQHVQQGNNELGSGDKCQDGAASE
jgi:hypothetical protein